MEKSEIYSWVLKDYQKWLNTGLSPVNVIEQVLHPKNVEELGKINSETAKQLIDILYETDPESLYLWVQDNLCSFSIEHKQTQRFVAIARNNYFNNDD